jgi:hypothetical protein
MIRSFFPAGRWGGVGCVSAGNTGANGGPYTDREKAPESPGKARFGVIRRSIVVPAFAGLKTPFFREAV